MKKLIVFDLDGTLAKSKSFLDTEMSTLLHDLLGTVKVAIISGGDWPQFEKQVISHLPHDQHLNNLSILPTCGTKFYRYSGSWKKIYSEDFTPEEAKKIIAAFSKALLIASVLFAVLPFITSSSSTFKTALCPKFSNFGLLPS